MRDEIKMIGVIKYVDDFSLRDELWSGAVDTMETIVENEKTQELMDLLEELYPEPVDITTLNDFMWFDDNYIYWKLGIKPKGSKSLPDEKIIKLKFDKN